MYTYMHLACSYVYFQKFCRIYSNIGSHEPVVGGGGMAHLGPRLAPPADVLCERIYSLTKTKTKCMHFE
jgi:hypothetical protein